jgi:hypothetical protein
MLSAAHDILKEEQGTNSTKPVANNTNILDCNPVSTGVSRSCQLRNFTCP